MLICGLLGVCSLYFPETPEMLRQGLNGILSGELDYGELIAAIGGREPKESQTEATENTAVQQQNSEAMEQWRQALAPAEPMPAENQIPEGDDFPPMVAAFIAKQLSFSGESIPANVRLDMPELPFDYVCPVEGSGSSGFGFREHPIEQVMKFHYGTDFAANGGTPVCAFAEATVSAVGRDDSYGNYIILSHGGGVKSLYAHLSSVSAAEGQQVKMGECIATVGATGLATGPHLHFELTMDGVYLNPEYYL